MKRLNIGILSHSIVITRGLCSLLGGIKQPEVCCHALMPDNIVTQIASKEIAVIMADPIHPAAQKLIEKQCDGLKKCPSLVAISAMALPPQYAMAYSATVSVYDSAEKIINTILNLAATRQDSDESRTDLTPREKEIVVGIVKGLSNKEIATEMNVSVNTVMTHRRNIASKLQIHSPAGLTIYAIVSKLVSIEDIRHSIDPTLA